MNTSTLQMRLLHAETIERDYATAATTCALVDRGPLLDMAHQASQRAFWLQNEINAWTVRMVIPEMPQ